MTQFKVGDKVRLKDGKSGFCHTPGKVYEIYSAGNEQTACVTDDDNDKSVSCGGRFELVAPPKVPGVFAVGDRVRVLKCSNGHTFKIGEVVTIVELPEYSVGPHKASGENNRGPYVRPRDIEHADTPATPEPDARIALADKALAWLKAEIAADDSYDAAGTSVCESMLYDVFGLRVERKPAVAASVDYVPV